MPGMMQTVVIMNRILLLDRLGQAERHIREGERHILRQREIIDELERHGRGQTRTANMAREILLAFEMTQSTHIADRERLIERLLAMRNDPSGVAPAPDAQANVPQDAHAEP